MNELKGIGLNPIELDLRQYFGKAAELKAELTKYDLMYIRGGSGFVLRRAYHHSGADKVIKELLSSDALVYAGYSAGPFMLCPSLEGIDGRVDLPDFIPEGYPDGPTIWQCLSILPYAIAPHYKSDHPETKEIDRTIEYYIANHIPFIALHDGEAIVVDAKGQRVVG
ncbi:MAG TPA: Type 1 glutamine amidotransferase-like domain-containing protein [Patescibacteria group bacterium]|nr:Type 1 glutamine amidotransferase-like domain-containing protein [Patescibacteria group bacterium]